MTIITNGKRLIPSEQVAFVEPFDPSANTEFKPEKDFKGRIILLDREIVLTEQTPQEFANEHKLHLFAEDGIAINPLIRFKIETFEPSDGFTPTKPYRTRIKWTDLGGEKQSKLLLTAPELVMNELLTAKRREKSATLKRPSGQPQRGRKGSRRMDAFQA